MKLLEQLKAKGIATVIINFDGLGDSGGIEGVSCYDQDNKKIEAGELEKALTELGDAIIERHYKIDFNNEGCSGEISLEVESGEIRIEINSRYVEYNTDYLKEETV